MTAGVSQAMYRMLVSIQNHGDPTRHLYGLSEHGGAHKTLAALRRRGLVTEVDGRLVLTDAGREALR